MQMRTPDLGSLAAAPLPPRVEPRGGALGAPAAALTAIGNEITKGLIDLWGGRIASLLELILFGVMYVAIGFAMGRGRLDPALLASTLVGFVGYMFFHMQTNRLFWGLLGEAQSGTLEQLYLSPLPSWVLTIGLTIASIIEAALTAGVLYLGVALGLRIMLAWSWEALVPLAVLVVGSVGYSLILGGLTLKFKRVELLKELFQLVAMLFGGVFVPIERMPEQVATIARFLPLTPGVEALRRVLLAGATLGALAADGTLLWLGISAVAYLGAGILVFHWFERVARRDGTLGQY
jgi:ABC-2 type transport system permease protein